MRASWVTTIIFVSAATGCATSQDVHRSTAPVSISCSAPRCAEPAQANAIDTFTSSKIGVELDKPKDGGWALATDVVSPQGNAIPVVVAHPDSGAQIVMQVSDGLDSPKAIATLLRQKLGEEGAIHLGETTALRIDNGADAYGFDFSVDGEAKGRVALIQLGEQIVLVVASWPPDAGNKLEKDVDAVVRSVRRPASGVTPTSMRPDKA